MTMGQNVVIEENVTIGQNCSFGHNVVIHSGTVIGDDVVVADNTVLGKQPFKSAVSATTTDTTLTPLVIGNGVKIGAGCVIYSGCKLGDNCFLGDMASVREDVSIGEKTVIGKSVTVENKCTIGAFVKIETGAYITAISTIEDHCFIAPMVTFSNDNYLGRTEERKKHFKGPILKRAARIGANATILPGKVLGEDCLVAAGSVVTKDVEPGVIVAGVPAKYFGKVKEEQRRKEC
jgi:acetyltransferase-like isoleucine patch superfamily enzyme